MAVAFNDGRTILIRKTEILKQSQIVINDFLRSYTLITFIMYLDQLSLASNVGASKLSLKNVCLITTTSATNLDHTNSI